MENQADQTFMESETYKNLQTAFEGEAQTSTKYAIYGEKARAEGYEQIGDIYEKTSQNEREHAEIWMKLLNGGEVPTTLENLRDSYGGENYEWSNLYIRFAEKAREEGFPEIARLFEGVAGIDRHHDSRFRKLAQNLVNGTAFCKKSNALWICLNCGNLFYGECAPTVCPVCAYPQSYYELNCENY